MPRSLNRSTAVSVPSIREVQRLAQRLADMALDELGIRIQGEKLSVPPKPAHVVNWLLARVGEMPRRDQLRLLSEGRAIFERHLASDTPIEFGLTVLERDEPENGDGSEATEPARKPRRRA